MTDHDHRPITPSLLVGGIVLALMAIIVLGFTTGCGRSDKPDTQFAPTKPLVLWAPYSGKSMLPTLPESGIVRIDFAASYDSLAKGEIVLLWDYVRGGYTLHRLVAKQGTWWIARGDNPVTNAEADAPFVTRSNFMGRMVQ